MLAAPQRVRSTLYRSVAGALSIGIFARFCVDTWGASAESAAHVALATVAARCVRPSSGARTIGMVLGAAVLWRAEDVARVLAAVAVPTAVPMLAGWLLALAAGIASGGGPAARDVARHPFALTLLLTLTGAGAYLAPREVALAALVLSAFARVPRLGAGQRVGAPLPRAFAVAGLLCMCLGGWALMRAPLDPSARGIEALFVGAALGTAASGRPLLGASMTLLAGTGAFVAARTDPNASAWFPVWALALPGLALTGGLAALAPSRSGLVLGGVSAMVALGPLLERTPPAAVRASTRSDRAAGASAGALVRARSDSLADHASVTPRGARVLWQRPDGSIWAELDGTSTEPTSRQGVAERFAGTLAGCLAVHRTSARLVGDDWGLVTLGARAQGFSRLDVSVNDPAFARAVARRRPELEAAWLDPAVRLLPSPGALLSIASAPTDALVQVIRAPWTDARAPLPSPYGLRAARRTLTDGGVHVLVVSTRLPPEALDGLARAMADTYPQASLWMPPDGMDTALLVGSLADTPRPWAAFDSCVRADEAALSRLSIRSALDLASLATLDAGAMRARTSGPWRSPGVAEALGAGSLTRYADVAFDPSAVFGAAAPLDDLAARAEARRGLLGVLDASTRGDAQGALERARSLRATPGGERALEPLITPHLERAAEALRIARREGPTSRRWDDVEAALGTARVLHPGFAPTLCLEGEAAGARGQLTRAEEAFTACVDADPRALAGWDGLARTRRSRDDLPGAEEALRGALKARPERWTGAHNLGVFLLESGRLDAAEQLLEQAASMAAREIPPPAAPLLALARLHLGTARPSLALAEAERANAIAPSADALALRGAARMELGSLELAEADFRAALDRDARNVLARGGLGQVHATRGEYDLAAAAFRLVLEQDPRNAAARENLRRLGPLLREPSVPRSDRQAAP